MESQGARTVHGPASGRAGKLHVSFGFGLLLAHFPPFLTTLLTTIYIVDQFIRRFNIHILTGKLCYIINGEITNVKMRRAFFIKSIPGSRNNNF